MMRLRSAAAMLLLAAAALIGCRPEQMEPAKPLADAQAVTASNRLGRSLYRELSGTPGNLALAPVGVATVLGLLSAGAEGGTAEELAAVLPLPVEGHPALASLLGRYRMAMNYQLLAANGLWMSADARLREDFLQVARDSYQAKAAAMDFRSPATVEVINGWVREQTRGMIQTAFSGLPRESHMVMCSTLWFRGRWAQAFDPASTSAEPFFAAGGERMVEMMRSTRRCAYADPPGAQVVALGYLGGDLDLLLAVPKERTGLAEVERRWIADGEQMLVQGLQEREVDLSLPRFTLSWNLDGRLALDPALRRLGLVSAFDRRSADFSRMADLGPEDRLWVDQMVQKVVMQVDEEGTVVAVATGGGMSFSRSMPPPPVVVRADRPFLFLLRDRVCGTVLLAGRLAAP